MDYILLTKVGEPKDYDKACQTTGASKWELAMKEEMKSLISNQTWELTKLPIRNNERITNGCIVKKMTMMALRDTNPD
jgi:hypothetical protein